MPFTLSYFAPAAACRKKRKHTELQIVAPICVFVVSYRSSLLAQSRASVHDFPSWTIVFDVTGNTDTF